MSHKHFEIDRKDSDNNELKWIKTTKDESGNDLAVVEEEVRIKKMVNGESSDEDDKSNVPFDRGWAWMISFSCFVIFFVYAGYEQVVSVLLVDILTDLDTTVSVMSVMFSVNTCFYCLSTQMSNNFVLNYISHRSLETGAAVVNVLATLTFVLRPNVTFFLITSFIKAASKGTSLISTMALVGHYFKKRRALAIALGLMGASVSAVAVPPLTRYLRDEYGLRGCFLLIASLEMHAILATMLLRPTESYSKIKQQKTSRQLHNGMNKVEEKPLLETLTVLDQLLPKLKPLIHLNDTKEITDEPTLYQDANNTKDSTNTSAVKLFNSKIDSTNTDLIIENFTELVLDKNVGNQKSSNATNIDLEVIEDNLESNQVIECRQSSVLSKSKKNCSAGIKLETGQHADTLNAQILLDKKHKVNEKDHHDVALSRSRVEWSSSILGSTLDITNTDDMATKQPMIIDDGPETNKNRKLTSWLQVIINVKLLKNVLFLLICGIYCLTNGGILNMMYLPSHARKVGVRPQDAAILLTISGSCDMVARVLSGIFADLKLVRVSTIMAVAMFVSGVSCQFLGFFLTFEHLLLYAALQGLMVSAGTSLNTVFIVETLGIGMLSKVLPMCSLFLTVTIAVQQLIVGALIEYTENYIVAFHYVGTMYNLATLLLLFVPMMKKIQSSRETKPLEKK